ncbi:MAG: hypothetical protein ACKOCX_09020 [Planctomycetota bacterium]
MASTDRLFGALGALVLAAAVAGCSSDGLVTSTGTVTCDGQPLADGAISFHPLDAGAAPQGSRIVSGRYRIRIRPGRQRVEIVASRPQANAGELTPGMKPLEQFLPPRYNTVSLLEAEVTAAGRNVFDFDLQTAP